MERLRECTVYGGTLCNLLHDNNILGGPRKVNKVWEVSASKEFLGGASPEFAQGTAMEEICVRLPHSWGERIWVCQGRQSGGPGRVKGAALDGA